MKLLCPTARWGQRAGLVVGAALSVERCVARVPRAVADRRAAAEPGSAAQYAIDVATGVDTTVISVGNDDSFPLSRPTSIPSPMCRHRCIWAWRFYIPASAQAVRVARAAPELLVVCTRAIRAHSTSRPVVPSVQPAHAHLRHLYMLVPVQRCATLAAPERPVMQTQGNHGPGCAGCAELCASRRCTARSSPIST